MAEGAKAPKKLGPADYERFFDPRFLEFFAVDTARAREAWAGRLRRACFRS